MRSGASAAQQTLTAEAASVLKHSLSLATRRGHGQVTPLHVAATLLSSRGSLLKRACLKSHPNQPSHPHPLHCRALELCFNVALNRLPTSPPLLHAHPSLSNALIAALKRAQANQRRGCIEQQQQHQQPLLTIKVELEQLIISILDDPSVSRVMREAGFSSTSIKNNIEDCSASSVFNCYSNNNGGVFSSPCSPDNFSTEIIHPQSFWPTHFFSYSSDQNPLLLSPPKKIPISQISCFAPFKEDIALVFDNLTSKRRRNTVIVGDSFSITESFISELMGKVKRGEVPHELKSAKFVDFPFTSVSLQFMKKEDMKTKIIELKKNVDTLISRGVGVIIYAGDLKWIVDGGGDQVSDYNPVDHLVAEIETLISSNCGSKKVWLMATSSYQIYMRCQMRQPPLETQWSLQAVYVPSGGLSLSLHASSVDHDSRIPNAETKPFTSKEEQDKLSCCVECSSDCEKEIQHLKSNQPKQVPPWLQPRETESRLRDEYVELKRKWNKICRSRHQSNSNIIGKNLSYVSSHPWWSMARSTLFDNSNSITLVDPVMKSSQSSNPATRFSRQQTCTINFNFGDEARGDEKIEFSLKSLKNLEDKAVKTTLALGNSLLCDSENSMVKNKRERKLRKDQVCKILAENVPWQSELTSSIADALIDAEFSKERAWILIHGNDSVGKRRLATAIAEMAFGSVDFLLQLNSRKEIEGSLRSEILIRALARNEKVVILIEDADLGDTEFVKFLADGIESGNLKALDQTERGFGQAIFILSKDDEDARHCEDRKKNQISMVHMIIEVQTNDGVTNPEHKRKADWDLPNKKKFPRKFEKQEECTTKIVSRHSSFNTLDLNLKAEENEEKPGELSPISSDLTRETATDQQSGKGFLESIENQYTFNRKHQQDQEIKEMFISKLKKASEEVMGEHKLDQFSIEEGVIEGIIQGSGSFSNSMLEKWLKEIFQSGLNKCRYGGKEGVALRLCLDTDEKGLLEKGFLGSCLPKTVKVAFLECKKEKTVYSVHV